MDTPSNSPNQRRDVRYDVQLAVEIYTGDDILHASTRNLSQSGVCLDMEVPLAEGNLVGVSLFLTNEGIEDPDVAPINIKASVIWCSEKDTGGFSAGARFEELDLDHQDAIVHFLKAIGED